MIERELLKKLAKKHDTNWDKVMKIAKENGFVTQAFAGTAILISNNEQIKSYGYEKYEKIQEMNSTLSQVEKLEEELE